MSNDVNPVQRPIRGVKPLGGPCRWSAAVLAIYARETGAGHGLPEDTLADAADERRS
jgi:hypothetical protein